MRGVRCAGYVEALVCHNELRVLLLDELSRRSGVLAGTCSVLDMGGLKTSLLMPGGGSKKEQQGFKAWQGGAKVREPEPSRAS